MGARAFLMERNALACPVRSSDDSQHCAMVLEGSTLGIWTAGYPLQYQNKSCSRRSMRRVCSCYSMCLDLVESTQRPRCQAWDLRTYARDWCPHSSASCTPLTQAGETATQVVSCVAQRRFQCGDARRLQRSGTRMEGKDLGSTLRVSECLIGRAENSGSSTITA